MDKLDQLHEDVAGLLMSVEGLRYTSIFIARAQLDADGNLITAPQILQQIKNALQGQTPRNGKVGTVIVIFPPQERVMDHQSNSAQILCEASITIQTAENLVLNNGSDGSKLSCAQITNLVFENLRYYPATAGAVLKADDKHGKTPVLTKEGYELYEQTFRCEWNRDQVTRCAPVVPVLASELLTLTTATDGATILYTTDGSFPQSENPTVLTYAAPVDISALVPFTLRTAAIKSGLGISKITTANLT